MLVKSKTSSQHIPHLDEMFQILRRYRMKLNPLKCTFGVLSVKFLGFMVSNRGIEVNLEKVKALLDMESPKNQKDVQKLTECIATLSRFISKSTDKCIPFFNTLQGNKQSQWTKECEMEFQ